LRLTDKHRVSAHIDPSLLTWGTVEALGQETLVAGETADIAVRVILDQAIPAGHSIEVWTHFVSDIARLQAESPDLPAFFSCQTESRPTLALTYPGAKVHGPGTFFPYRRYAAIALPEGGQPGDAFLFRLQDVSQQTYEEMPFNLRFAIVDGDQVVGYLGDAFYRIVGSAPASLWLIAPTCVEIGEPFACQIVVRDRYGNKSGALLDDLSLDLGTEAGPGEMTTGEVAWDAEQRRHTVRGLTCSTEGTYYLRAYVRGSPSVTQMCSIRGVSNPIVVRERWEERVYWGDVHQHAYYADGRGTPAANYEYAISTSCLDFCSVAPHQEAVFAPGWLRVPGAPPQTGWQELIEAAKRYHGDEIVTILGSEAGSLAPVAGHMNSYYLDTSNRPELERLVGRWWELPERPRLESYQQYLDELERSRGEFLLLPHAHARGGPGRFDLPLRPSYQTNVEICSVHGVFEPFYEQWLQHGHFVGVQGSGDNHMTSTGNGNPGWHYPNTNGLAGAWAGERTRRGIWDAIRDRRTLGVTGNERIFLDLSIEGHMMGSLVIGAEGPRRVHAEIAGTAPVMRVDLIRNGEMICIFTPPLDQHRTLRLAWTDDWNSRRVDDSRTTGTIGLEDGQLALIAPLHAYHRTDAFSERAGEIAYRSNGYSGITRGALLRAAGARERLCFEIEDLHLGQPVLEARFEIPLDARHARLTRTLEVAERFLHTLFTREIHHPQFALEVDWVDLDWPRALAVDWEDADPSPAYYYLRVEQIDGNIAWSSPVWFLDRHPGQDIPGHVVSL
jgi:hypothetical protein